MAEVVMSPELYRAAMEWDMNIFNQQEWEEGRTASAAAANSWNTNDIFEKYFLSRTLEDRNNILHVSAVHHQNGTSLNFVKQVLEKFPSLVCQVNTKGDNPLHVYARYGNKEAVELLVRYYKASLEPDPTSSMGATKTELLWRMKNSEGDTPLHVALKRCKTDVALFFINLDDDLASIVNHSNETPLHLAAASFSTHVCALKIGSNSSLISMYQKHHVIELLLEKASSTASKRDADTLTPLLRAACYRKCVPVILAILDHNPQLAEQRDPRGRTMLHLMKLQSYEEWKKVMKICVVKALKDEQDFEGNTPMHLAIQDSHFLKARILLECSVDLRIKNRHGVCAWDLIETQDDFLRNLKETDKALNGLMKKDMYKAAVEGNINFLSQHDDVYLASRSVDGNNILHLAMGPDSFDQREFVVTILERLPILLFQTNSQGNTPLHLAARRSILAALELMRFCKESFQKTVSEVTSLSLFPPPWKARNSDGNTPLHEALLAANAFSARILVHIDNEVAQYVNNSGQTPLHLCARFKQEDKHTLFAERTWPEYVRLTQDDEVDLLLSINISAACLRDADGFTPLLRAAQSNRLELVERILGHCPGSTQVHDFDGRTLLHHMPLKNEKSVLDRPEVSDLIMAQDYEGNTALQVAIRNRNFSKVKVLLQKFPYQNLAVTNNCADSALDLIRLQPDVPEELEPSRFRYRSKSLYGVNEAATKENVNTLLVIAVLLATITFAGAFTVPGGFDQSKGTPILIRETAFKLFLISDTWAMCCSMLALFSLVWVMTDRIWHSMKLLDFSIFLLLQMSFYATILAFMTGVFVTTSSETLWMAILVCVMCFGLMVSSLKPVILRLARRLPHFLKAID